MKDIDNAGSVRFWVWVSVNLCRLTPTSRCFCYEKNATHSRPLKRRGSWTSKVPLNLSPKVNCRLVVGMVFQAWRQLYLFISKPRRLPSQYGSALSACSERLGVKGTKSAVSETSPRVVLFVGGANSGEFVKSRMVGRVSARVEGVSSRRRWPVYSMKDMIVQCLQRQVLSI